VSARIEVSKPAAYIFVTELLPTLQTAHSLPVSLPASLMLERLLLGAALGMLGIARRLLIG
jgi:hypothetical protein